MYVCVATANMFVTLNKLLVESEMDSSDNDEGEKIFYDRKLTCRVVEARNLTSEKTCTLRLAVPVYEHNV